MGYFLVRIERFRFLRVLRRSFINVVSVVEFFVIIYFFLFIRGFILERGFISVRSVGKFLDGVLIFFDIRGFTFWKSSTSIMKVEIF